ncbi:Golgi-associated plant pathogenesis-related protein 1 isoform X1 [Rissa tridactyla]|uniref:Golgi-associated plant pathogenesis-related protein 1 isoform X1 n=1 Tax=Rissa tridactyla TaxID=75485 RepID=UPI0023BA7C38|nr:Golgi-associated plant pathogenesis-related protein 1 isoform X1 [Rissa tridactyla]
MKITLHLKMFPKAFSGFFHKAVGHIKSWISCVLIPPSVAAITVGYAEELATTRVLKHSSESANGKCGENLAWASYDQPGKDVADRWYSEIKNYSFQNPGFSSGTGHFTAMVWKNTKKMGVGKASASDGSTFVVARYDPAGNVVNPGYYEENVLPPRK